MEDNVKEKKYGRRPGKKLEDDLKTNEKWKTTTSTIKKNRP